MERYMRTPESVTKRKIGFLSPVPNFKGGAERSLFDLMDNTQIHPILIVPEEGPISRQAAAQGIPVCVVSFGSVSLIRRPLRPRALLRALADWRRAAIQVKQAVRAEEIDIVHSNGLKAHAIAGLSSRMGGAPWVPHIRDIAITGIERVIWRGLVRFSAHTIFVSRACWPGKSLPANASVVFNSIAEQNQTLAPAPAGGDGECVIGICGRIHWWKGHHIALEWLAAARDRGLDVRLIIRGEAADEDLNYIEQLKAQAVDLGLKNKVSFEGFKEGLQQVYGGLNAVLVPSQIPDPLPRSVMEAMAVGVPVIGYPAGGITEMIEHGYNGWLTDTSEGFCTVIAEIAALDSKGLERFQLQASETVRLRFGRTQMYDSLNAVYQQILETRSRGR